MEEDKTPVYKSSPFDARLHLLKQVHKLNRETGPILKEIFRKLSSTSDETVACKETAEDRGAAKAKLMEEAFQAIASDCLDVRRALAIAVRHHMLDDILHPGDQEEFLADLMKLEQIIEYFLGISASSAKNASSAPAQSKDIPQAIHQAQSAEPPMKEEP